MKDTEVTVKQFVFCLWKEFNQNQVPDILHYGHMRGWLEDEDEVNPDSLITRRTAARILHQFMKIELRISDMDDISPAEVLKDLYTCRVCVNHVAQIYLRKIMTSEEVEREGEVFSIFNMAGTISEAEMKEIFHKLHKLIDASIRQ